MDIFLDALLIFLLRVLGIALNTLATLMTVQGRRFHAMGANFFTALVYVVAIGRVVSNLHNIWNILAYSSGVAVGTWVGMLWEERMALGFAEIRIISTHHSDALANALRQAGFGVTEFYGRGRQDAVGIAEIIVPRKNVEDVLGIANRVDERAIITVTEARLVRRGYWNHTHR